MKKKLLSAVLAVIIALTAIPGITAGAATKKISSLSVAKISNQVYRAGEALKPSVTIKDGSKTLKSGTDYTLSYSKNKKIGKASVKIKGKGNYSGTKTVSFKIVPKKVGSLSVSESKGVISIAWGAVGGAITGYEIYYKSSEDGEYKLLKTTGASNMSFTTNALDSGTTYYFRIRAYKTVDGKNFYGAYKAKKSSTNSKTSGAKKTIQVFKPGRGFVEVEVE